MRPPPRVFGQRTTQVRQQILSPNVAAADWLGDVKVLVIPVGFHGQERRADRKLELLDLAQSGLCIVLVLNVCRDRASYEAEYFLLHDFNVFEGLSSVQLGESSILSAGYVS